MYKLFKLSSILILVLAVLLGGGLGLGQYSLTQQLQTKLGECESKLQKIGVRVKSSSLESGIFKVQGNYQLQSDASPLKPVIAKLDFYYLPGILWKLKFPDASWQSLMFVEGNFEDERDHSKLAQTTTYVDWQFKSQSTGQLFVSPISIYQTAKFKLDSQDVLGRTRWHLVGNLISPPGPFKIKGHDSLEFQVATGAFDSLIDWQEGLWPEIHASLTLPQVKLGPVGQAASIEIHDSSFKYNQLDNANLNFETHYLIDVKSIMLEGMDFGPLQLDASSRFNNIKAIEDYTNELKDTHSSTLTPAERDKMMLRMFNIANEGFDIEINKFKYGTPTGDVDFKFGLKLAGDKTPFKSIDEIWPRIMPRLDLNLDAELPKSLLLQALSKLPVYQSIPTRPTVAPLPASNTVVAIAPSTTDIGSISPTTQANPEPLMSSPKPSLAATQAPKLMFNEILLPPSSALDKTLPTPIAASPVVAPVQATATVASLAPLQVATAISPVVPVAPSLVPAPETAASIVSLQDPALVSAQEYLNMAVTANLLVMDKDRYRLKLVFKESTLLVNDKPLDMNLISGVSH